MSNARPASGSSQLLKQSAGTTRNLDLPARRGLLAQPSPATMVGIRGVSNRVTEDVLMNWPELNEAGDLPPGIHPAALADVIARFGRSSDRRLYLGQRLERLYDLAMQTGHLARFVIFGSFVTAKVEPGDVDVLVLLDDEFDSKQLSGEVRQVFRYEVAKTHLGINLFATTLRGALAGAEATIAGCQRKRDGSLRGIVEVRES
jgi:hypothetical protein